VREREQQVCLTRSCWIFSGCCDSVLYVLVYCMCLRDSRHIEIELCLIFIYPPTAVFPTALFMPLSLTLPLSFFHSSHPLTRSHFHFQLLILEQFPPLSLIALHSGTRCAITRTARSRTPNTVIQRCKPKRIEPRIGCARKWPRCSCRSSCRRSSNNRLFRVSRVSSRMKPTSGRF
jgi:hypothetical protein